MALTAAERCKRYRQRHPTKTSEYYIKNSADIAKKKRLHNQVLKIEIIAHYSAGSMGCALCPEARLGALSIDHIDGCGATHREQIKKGGGRDFYAWLRNSNFPDGYRVLCANCNFKQYLILNKNTHRAGGSYSRNSAHNLKLKLMNKLGGRCLICGTTDLDTLTVHHINNDGADHRRKISDGRGGGKFYRALLLAGDLTGLECRCFSCNCNEEWQWAN
jgi:hypothetical protein